MIFLSKIIIRKYQPQIILVLGSEGINSIASMLTDIFRRNNLTTQSNVYEDGRSETEIFSALSNLSQHYKNKFWIGLVLLRLVFLKIFRKVVYPDILILEIKNEQLDLISKITKDAKCIVILSSMLNDNQCLDLNPMKIEIQKLLHSVSKDSILVYNKDDEQIIKIVNKINIQQLPCSLNSEAFIMASNINTHTKEETGEVDYTTFKMHYHGSVVPVVLQSRSGNLSVNNAIMSIACGLHLNLNLIDIIEVFKKNDSDSVVS